MLELPSFGFQPSIDVHNSRLDILCDWIEGSVLFADAQVSQSDVVDILHENNIYTDQAFAFEWIEDAWKELSRRADCVCNGLPFEIEGAVISRTAEWKDVPAYSFCVILTLQTMYKQWARQFGADYGEQGELFEELVAESLASLGWDTLRTGWSSTSIRDLPALVETIAAHLDEAPLLQGLPRWTSEGTKDAGLDIVIADAFVDRLAGRAVYLVQCASGGNWNEKFCTPSLEQWGKLVDFATAPLHALAVPFAFLHDNFRQTCLRVKGMFLDRYRLIDGCDDCLSKGLSKKIVKWVARRASKLPVLRI